MEAKKSNEANLRNKKLLFLEIGAILSLTVVLLAFEWPTKDVNVQIFDDHRAIIVDPDMIAIRPYQPEQPEIPELTDILIVVDSEIDVFDYTIIHSADMPTGTIIYIDPKPEEVAVDEIPFEVTETKPTPPGRGETNDSGMSISDFSKWVSSKIIYPQSAVNNYIQGRIWVQFTIATDGSVTNIEILRSIDAALDKEIVRVVSMSPKWRPGTRFGKPVPITIRTPITFQIR